MKRVCCGLSVGVQGVMKNMKRACWPKTISNEYICCGFSVGVGVAKDMKRAYWLKTISSDYTCCGFSVGVGVTKDMKRACWPKTISNDYTCCRSSVWGGDAVADGHHFTNHRQVRHRGRLAALGTRGHHSVWVCHGVQQGVLTKGDFVLLKRWWWNTYSMETSNFPNGMNKVFCILYSINMSLKMTARHTPRSPESEDLLVRSQICGSPCSLR